jgi:hypothetical protein
VPAWSGQQIAAQCFLPCIIRTELPAASDDPVTVVADRLRSTDNEAVAVRESRRVVGVVTPQYLANVEVPLDHLDNGRADAPSGEIPRRSSFGVRRSHEDVCGEPRAIDAQCGPGGVTPSSIRITENCVS